MSKLKAGKEIKLEYVPTERQLAAHLCNEQVILFGGAIGGGKAQVLTTQVLTTENWKLLMNIHPGDTVIDKDGEPTKVLRESEVNCTRDMYKVIFNDGAEEVIACEDHQWLVRDHKNREKVYRRSDEYREKRRKKRPYRGTGVRRDLMVANAEREYAHKFPPESFIATTKEMFENKHFKSGTNPKGANYTVDVINPVQLPKKEYIVPPYVLGSFIGDGSTNTGTISGYDNPVYDKVESYGYDMRRHKNPVTRSFKNLKQDLALIGITTAKHIPQNYLFGSYSQRLELVQGLMDTDGTIAKNGACEFSSSLKHISDDLCFLLRSFGIKCNVCTNEAYSYNDGKKQCKDRHRIKFRTTLPVFTLPRHLARLPKKLDQRHQYHHITDIIKVPSEPMKCIEVDSPSHTYLCSKSLIPTHNSVWGVNDMLQSCLDFSENRVGIFRWENTVFTNSTFKTVEEWIFRVKGLVKHHNKKDRIITLFNNSAIFYGGLKPSSSTTGDLLATTKSLELSCCFLDEVSDFPEEVLTFLFGRIGRWRGIDNKTGKRVIVPKRLICSSNPVPGWVKKRWIDNKLEKHAFIQSKASDNPHLGTDYVSDLRKMWEGDEKKIQKLLEGDWDAIEDHEALISYASILIAAKKNIEPRPSDEVIIACDVAAFGDDTTVIGMRKGNHAELLEVLKDKDTMFIAERLAWYNAIYKPEYINVDAIGIGQGVCDRLDQLEIPCNRVVAGEPAFNPEKFINMRAEMYWHFRSLLKKEIIDIPDDSILHGDLASVRYEISGDRKIKIESKREMKKRTGKSPDYADCFVMLFKDACSPYQISGLL